MGENDQIKDNSDIVKERLKEILKTFELDSRTPSLIQNNEIVFFVEGKMYKCSMPTQKQKAFAENKKNTLYIKLINEGKCLTRTQLIKVLKEKINLDIKALENDKKVLEDIRYDLYIDLANKINSDEKTIEDLKLKISEVQMKALEISFEISKHLSSCLEDTLEKEYIECLTYLCSKRLKENSTDEWENVWNSYEDFQNDNTKILDKCIEFFSYLIISARE